MLSHNIKKITLFSLLISCLFIFPLTFVTLAADTPPPPIAHQASGLVPCGAGDAGPEDCTFKSLIDLSNNVLSFAFYVATLIAAGLIIYAGGRMVYYASTNPGEAKKAKGILWNVIIGYAIIVVAWLVVRDLVTFFAGDEGPLYEAINKVFK